MELITSLARAIEKSEPDTLNLVLSAPYRYRRYTIPKRTHGRRLIAQPTKEIKAVQKAFVKIRTFPIHPAAMAYRKGVSIKDNAQAHKLNSYLLKMDLTDFFNSITPSVFWRVWEKVWPLPERLEMLLIERIIFWSNEDELMLSVGAPSSPVVSNFCMYFFDDYISTLCDQFDLVYTRYADDLTFSTNKTNLLFEMPSIVGAVLKTEFNDFLAINKSKTIYSSKAHNRHITGITITNNNELSIGREKKRYIKHLVHQHLVCKLSIEDSNHLRGLLSFVSHIEPTFIKSLKNKYSEETIDKLLRGSYE
ncbi:RNA-directed DNA polymerase [Vibrio breoganii]|uniref:retron St85 family RNA-directed DNA polymerase n=1 Tax=Vibrio breoganii TaxID=553239 RepID=UPI000C83EF17|nr:retron St85 family RNA-directed DNA polymerase [Vibrio breoganii]PMM79337.1 RNA-dependent DNA polymerase [Vibrio breoganii]TKF84848.1 RNA-directed DNA polymerase [Vibrio breoganii]